LTDNLQRGILLLGETPGTAHTQEAGLAQSGGNEMSAGSALGIAAAVAVAVTAIGWRTVLTMLAVSIVALAVVGFVNVTSIMLS
jgi:hypothetical protein